MRITSGRVQGVESQKNPTLQSIPATVGIFQTGGVGNFFSRKDGVVPVEHLDFSQFVSVRAVNLARCQHDTVLTAGRLYRTLREVLVCFLGDYPFFAPFYGGHSYAVRTLQADSAAPIP